MCDDEEALIVAEGSDESYLQRAASEEAPLCTSHTSRAGSVRS